MLCSILFFQDYIKSSTLQVTYETLETSVIFTMKKIPYSLEHLQWDVSVLMLQILFT